MIEKKNPWPLRWAQIVESGTLSWTETTLEFYELLCRKYRCARCGRQDLPLALFFQHDSSCSFESAIFKSSCELADEIKNMEWEIDDLKCKLMPAATPAKEILLPTEYTCDKCEGLFDREHMRYIPNGIACVWCFRHLP